MNFGCGQLLTETTLVALARTVTSELVHGPRLLHELGSIGEFHRIKLVRNFGNMLAANFPERRSNIRELLDVWDAPEYKSSIDAVALIDTLLDLVVHVKVVALKHMV